MFARRRLACSFCRKNNEQVAKLVAGPRVYICDECVAIAVRIMQDNGTNTLGPANVESGLLKKFVDRLRSLVKPNREIARCDNPL
ncbi:MAG TPA: ClpX C4-type zinc finger protein [Terriglobia bacterium]|nr:ClpX C4-type zinc finger protein [Terriglobia bacterium]